MNYLAHIFLSNKDPKIMMGNFLGDLIKNREYKALPEELKRGVELHRKIDSYTDNHHIVEKGVKIIQPYHGKYAPVVVDIYYDYLLFKNWDKYTDDSIQDFANWAYQVIEEHIDYVPERNQGKVTMMAKHNWLLSYGQLDELHQTFLRVKKRARYDSHFETATQHLQENYEVLNSDFNDFFPDLLQMTQDFIAKN
jgi:acyl carrier protein phosphodiesterase